MKFITLLIIIIIVLGLWWYVKPDSFNNFTNSIFKNKNPLGDANSDTKFRTTIDNVVSNNSTNVTTTTTVCDRSKKGMPDYDGTSKEGDSCADVPTNNDLECLNNPPSNYDGWINVLKKQSDPAIGCCLTDGYCHWS